VSTNEPFTWGAESLGRGGGGAGRARSTSRRTSLLSARAAALIVDGLVLLVPVFGISYALSRAFPDHGFFFHSRGSAGGVGIALELPGALLISALSLSYFFLFESLRGQTIGKRVMGLRVEAARGGPAGLNAVSTRTVLRLVDGLALYLLGALIATVTGPRRRRLGDWLGGTVVVRDESPGADSRERRPVVRVLAYPLSWIAAVLIATFALGLGGMAGDGERAIALVQAYVKAREQGDRSLACSLLTREQQREMVAIQTRDYRSASASGCPAVILETDPASHLLNPSLAEFAAGPMTVLDSTAQFAVVRSDQAPGLELITVFESGGAKLDMRGAERAGFLRGCDAAHRLSGAQCECVFATTRADGLIEEAMHGELSPAFRATAVSCVRGPTASGAARLPTAGS
jgi:uncharacterized RDD family membrane protein YckC